jgi:uncharacterized OsmC-like protein
MFALTVTSGPQLEVAGRNNKRFVYATDGSAPNPLEAAYATLVGCAGVYAKKACKQLGIAPDGIQVRGAAVASAGNPLMLTRFVTEVTFAAHFTEEQRAAVLAAIETCAVKEMIQRGPEIAFVVQEAVAA